jgi:hypothetical protein
VRKLRGHFLVPSAGGRFSGPQPQGRAPRQVRGRGRFASLAARSRPGWNHPRQRAATRCPVRQAAHGPGTGAGEPGRRRPGEGWRLTDAGATEIGGTLPVNPSGGVLSSNPIGASGLLRFAEAALQVMGKAGAHQVPEARTALGHAYGGGSQYFSMWVVSSEQ